METSRRDRFLPIWSPLRRRTPGESWPSSRSTRCWLTEISSFIRESAEPGRGWVPRERRACLSWRVGDDTISVPGEVQNISGGGVAVQTDVAPPWNQTIWLSLGPVGEEAGPAECRLVGFRNDQPGKLIARFAFVDLCPLQLYQAAVEIPK